MSKKHQHPRNNNYDNFLSHEVATEQDLTGIRNLIKQFVDAWNKHDAKLFSSIFVDDGEWTDVMEYIR